VLFVYSKSIKPNPNKRQFAIERLRGWRRFGLQLESAPPAAHAGDGITCSEICGYFVAVGAASVKPDMVLIRPVR
jgi:hypothetical protein